MGDILKLNTIHDYLEFLGVKTLLPLVSVIGLSEVPPVRLARKNFGFYTVFLKDVKCGDLRYGRKMYDYQEGTLVFIAPGQIVGDGMGVAFPSRFIIGDVFGAQDEGLFFFLLRGERGSSYV